MNLELDIKQREMNECEAKLIKKERELGQKKFEVEKTKEQLTTLKDQSESTNKPEISIKKGKRIVQTTFFKPIILKERADSENIEELIKKIEDIDINSMTPIDAMKKLIELKEKIRNIG